MPWGQFDTRRIKFAYVGDSLYSFCKAVTSLIVFSVTYLLQHSFMFILLRRCILLLEFTILKKVYRCSSGLM